MLAKIRTMKNKKFKSLKDFSELDFTCDKYSTYPSRSKEHHAGGDLFGKQHDRSCSDPELFPHQDSTDPSLLGIFSGSQADHHMASTP